MKSPLRLVGVLVLLVGGMLAGAGSAMADAPVTWTNPKPTTFLHNLVLFGGGTLGLFILVVLFGLLTARNNYVPPPPSTDLEKAPGSTPAHH